MITYYVVFVLARSAADVIVRTSDGSFLLSFLSRD